MQNFKVLEGIGYAPLLNQGISAENQCLYIVTTLLGPSLEDLRFLCGRNFSLKTTLMVFYQLLERLEWMFSKKYIHRDIKPDNMMMGTDENSTILHMIDFGLTHRYID